MNAARSKFDDDTLHLKILTLIAGRSSGSEAACRLLTEAVRYFGLIMRPVLQERLLEDLQAIETGVADLANLIEDVRQVLVFTYGRIHPDSPVVDAPRAVRLLRPRPTDDELYQLVVTEVAEKAVGLIIQCSYLWVSARFFGSTGRYEVQRMLLQDVASNYSGLGRLDCVAKVLNEILMLDHAYGRPEEVAATQLRMGVVARMSGDLDGALNFLERATSFYENHGSVERLAEAKVCVGAICRERGDLSLAKNHFLEASLIFEQFEMVDDLAEVWVNLALVASDQGDASTARHLYERALAYFNQSGPLDYVADIWTSLGNLAHDEKDFRAAINYYEKALTYYVEHGVDAGVAVIHGNLGNCASVQGDYEKAIRHYLKAFIWYRENGWVGAVAVCWLNIGILAGYRGYWDVSERLVRKARDQYLRDGHRLQGAEAAVALAEVVAQTGRTSDALSLAVPALLMMDSLRFTLPKPRDRALWSSKCSRAYELSFSWIVDCGDWGLLAALIESARASGVPSPHPVDDVSVKPLSVLRMGSVMPNRDCFNAGGDVDTDSPALRQAAFAGPAASTGSSDIALNPPPLVVMPWVGPDLLQPYREEAQRLLGGRPLRLGRTWLTDQLR